MRHILTERQTKQRLEEKLTVVLMQQDEEKDDTGQESRWLPQVHHHHDHDDDGDHLSRWMDELCDKWHRSHEEVGTEVQRRAEDAGRMEQVSKSSKDQHSVWR